MYTKTRFIALMACLASVPALAENPEWMNSQYEVGAGYSGDTTQAASAIPNAAAVNILHLNQYGTGLKLGIHKLGTSNENRPAYGGTIGVESNSWNGDRMGLGFRLDPAMAGFYAELAPALHRRDDVDGNPVGATRMIFMPYFGGNIATDTQGVGLQFGADTEQKMSELVALKARLVGGIHGGTDDGEGGSTDLYLQAAASARVRLGEKSPWYVRPEWSASAHRVADRLPGSDAPGSFREQKGMIFFGRDSSARSAR